MEQVNHTEGKMNVLVIILAGIICASLGQVFWKMGMNAVGAIDSISLPTILSMFSAPLVILGLCMYGLSTVFWLIALSRKDLSYVYPFIALTFIIVLLLSKFLLHETVGMARIIGTLIIIGGLLLVVWS
ncbi:MAG TPA: EamA family transporter [Methanoregulaceae archaeon]|nr:EamA family transporter [Methanoregulaceae archaeon]HPD75518.1 EamA family transporter [Methanoregulaceae archaeon]HRY75721.1 EamA family transporter [Methanoregulaceae archaeon]